MSDSETKGLKKFAQTPLFTFSKPYLDFIGKGTIFNLVYIVMALVNIVLPFVIIAYVINLGLFSLGGKFVVAIILAWLVVLFACWIGFQLWWERKSKIATVENSEFVATPIVADIFRTFGEWLGTMIAIIGAGVGIIATIILGKDMSYIPGMDSGALVIIAGPVLGFFIIIISRFLAELLKIFVALANNTKEIAENIKK